MANPNTPITTATPVVRAAVDEAVRIATDTSRRTTDSAQAALDFATQVNRDLLALWTSATETSLTTTFEAQTAALASTQALFETVTKFNQAVLGRWIDVTRQAQATTLKTYQSSTKFVTPA